MSVDHSKKICHSCEGLSPDCCFKTITCMMYVIVISVTGILQEEQLWTRMTRILCVDMIT